MEIGLLCRSRIDLGLDVPAQRLAGINHLADQNRGEGAQETGAKADKEDGAVAVCALDVQQGAADRASEQGGQGVQSDRKSVV